MPGAMTGGILCSLLQLAFNELRVWRVRYVFRERGDQSVDALPTFASQASSPKTRSAESEADKQPAWERFLFLVGMHKMTEEEHIKTLQDQRDAVLRRIAMLEEEERLQQSETSESGESGI